MSGRLSMNDEATASAPTTSAPSVARIAISATPTVVRRAVRFDRRRVLLRRRAALVRLLVSFTGAGPRVAAARLVHADGRRPPNAFDGWPAGPAAPSPAKALRRAH